MKLLSNTARWLARKSGYSLVRCQRENGFPVDFSEHDIQVIRRVAPYTKIGPERLHALIQAVSHAASNNIPGAIVECGVWRGGSMMAAAMTLQRLDSSDRHLYLYDTFEGMVKPTDEDVSYKGIKASSKFQKRRIHDGSSHWCHASLDDVRAAMNSTGYDPANIHFIQGKVEETLPGEAPERIAVLRLDTDWYESTLHELVHLYPRLSEGGVIIIDDYGDWLSAKKAVDQYLAEHQVSFLLHRIDDSARIGVKLARAA